MSYVNSRDLNTRLVKELFNNNNLHRQVLVFYTSIRCTSVRQVPNHVLQMKDEIKSFLKVQ